MFSKILNWLKGAMAKMLNLTGDKRIAGGVPVAVSSDMAVAIQRWRNEYIGRPDWLAEQGRTRQSLKLPALIASEMATLITLEAQINITGSKRAEWLNEQFAPVLANLHTQVEYACAMGGIVMKPYVDGDKIAIDYVHATDFYPVAFNARGEITAAAFVERKHIGKTVYSRVEYHRVSGSVYTITNDCYRGYNDDDVGQPAQLAEVDEWKDIQPVVTIENIDFPLFAYFRIPLGNAIDPKSPLGVSIYAKAEDTIKEADFQYQRLLWEYEGGEMAIDASENAIIYDQNGDPVLPKGKERLYRLNGLSSKESGSGDSLYKLFAPDLRDASYKAGLNDILKKIEDQTGLSRGTLSDPENITKTAEEIRTTKQRTYATVTAIQMSLQRALECLIRAMDATATLYSLAPAGNYDVSFLWDDSVVIDAETERMRDLQEIRDGIMQKWEYRVKWYGEDEQTAKRMTQNQSESDDEIMGFNRPPNIPDNSDQKEEPKQ